MIYFTASVSGREKGFMNQQEIIEIFIYEYPVCEICHLDTKDLFITEEVRQMCANESRGAIPGWYYPPALSSIEECKMRIFRYRNGFLFSTVAEVNDAQDFMGCETVRRDHERLTYDIQERFRENFGDVMTFTTGCSFCKPCHCIQGECIYPEKRLYTMESHGIMIMRTIVDKGLTYQYGNQVATYFSLILYND